MRAWEVASSSAHILNFKFQSKYFPTLYIRVMSGVKQLRSQIANSYKVFTSNKTLFVAESKKLDLTESSKRVDLCQQLNEKNLNEVQKLNKQYLALAKEQIESAKVTPKSLQLIFGKNFEKIPEGLEMSTQGYINLYKCRFNQIRAKLSKDLRSEKQEYISDIRNRLGNIAEALPLLKQSPKNFEFFENLFNKLNTPYIVAEEQKKKRKNARAQFRRRPPMCLRRKIALP